MNLIYEKKCISVVHVDSVKIFWGGGGTVSLWICMSVTENMAKQLFAKPLNSYQDLNIYVHMYIYVDLKLNMATTDLTTALENQAQ